MEEKKRKEESGEAERERVEIEAKKKKDADRWYAMEHEKYKWFEEKYGETVEGEKI